MIQIDQIKLNPKNPRVISDAKFEKLCQSVKDFPKMMELRPIVVDKSGMILGGSLSIMGYLTGPGTINGIRQSALRLISGTYRHRLKIKNQRQ